MSENVERPTDQHFRYFVRKGRIEARPYVSDEDMTGISVSPEDSRRMTLDGGMIARNPDNHRDQWYIATDYFSKHYEEETT